MFIFPGNAAPPRCQSPVSGPASRTSHGDLGCVTGVLMPIRSSHKHRRRTSKPMAALVSDQLLPHASVIRYRRYFRRLQAACAHGLGCYNGYALSCGISIYAPFFFLPSKWNQVSDSTKGTALRGGAKTYRSRLICRSFCFSGTLCELHNFRYSVHNCLGALITSSMPI